MSDVYSANTVLLLSMEGSNGSTTFTDTSQFPATVTVYGNAQISTTQSKWSQGAGYFDGSGDYLTVPDSNQLKLVSNDFTIECWIYRSALDAVNNKMLITKRPSANPAYEWGFFCGTDAKPIFFTWDGTHSESVSATTALSATTWYHLAVSLQGTALRLFVNGTLENTTTLQYALGNADVPIYIGRDPTTPINRDFYGYLQDVRITKGVARYTATFTNPGTRLPNPDPITGLIIQSGYRHDMYDGGSYRITGTVSELGVPGPYRVRLFDRYSARCIRETWSNASGAYAFDNLVYRANGYFAVAYDHGDNPLNAAIADLITPELMP